MENSVSAICAPAAGPFGSDGEVDMARTCGNGRWLEYRRRRPCLKQQRSHRSVSVSRTIARYRACENSAEPAFPCRALQEQLSMDQIQAMRVFVRVVEAGNFTRAADSLDLPKGTVTKQIQALEEIGRAHV